MTRAQITTAALIAPAYAASLALYPVALVFAFQAKAWTRWWEEEGPA